MTDDETPAEAIQGVAQVLVRDNEWRQPQARGDRTPAAVYFGSSVEQSSFILALFCLDDGVRLSGETVTALYNTLAGISSSAITIADKERIIESPVFTD